MGNANLFLLIHFYFLCYVICVELSVKLYSTLKTYNSKQKKYCRLYHAFGLCFSIQSTSFEVVKACNTPIKNIPTTLMVRNKVS